MIYIIIATIAILFTIIFKLPLVMIVLFLAFTIFGFYVLKKRKSVNIAFYILSMSFIGLILYSVFLTDTKLVATLTEKEVADGYESIYRNLSFHTIDVKLQFNQYYVRVAIFSGKFNIGTVNRVMQIPYFEFIVSKIFLGINLICLIVGIIGIYKVGIKIPKSSDYYNFIKKERKKSLIKQLNTFVLINGVIMIFFIKEEFLIYTSNISSVSLENSSFLSFISPLDLVVGSMLKTIVGIFNIEVNFLMVLVYLFLITSIVLLSFSNKTIESKKQNSLKLLISSFCFFLVSMIGNIFSKSIINNSIEKIKESILEKTSNYYIILVNGSDIIKVYKIIGTIIISLVYIYIILISYINNKHELRIHPEKPLVIDISNRIQK